MPAKTGPASVRRATSAALALALLSAGTDVALAQADPQESAALEPITVQGERSALPAPRDASRLLPALPGGQLATGTQLGVLGNRDALSTPFNTAGYTARLIADSQARSIADVAANDPSVRVIFPRASYRDVFTIRGFNLFSYNTGFDGLYGIAPKQRYPAEFAERIEILKGPDTFLNGVSLGGSVGGAINIVPKRAGDEPVASLTASYGSSATLGTHVDLGRRFGAGKEFGVRFNGLLRGGDTGIDDQAAEFGGAALALDYQGERLRLYGDLGAQRQAIDAPDWSATLAPGIFPIPVPRNRASLSQPWAQLTTRDAFGVVRAEYDLSEDWTLFGAFGLSDTQTTGIYVQPTMLRANGDFVGTAASLPSAGAHRSGQVGIRGRFATGDVTHNVTAAFARWDQDLKAARFGLGSFSSNLFGNAAIARPDTSRLAGIGDIPRTTAHRYGSLVVADTLGLFDERLLLTLGGRWQVISNADFSATTGARTASYEKTRFSPAAAAVLKLSNEVSVYGNYVEALQRGASAPANAANYGETFAPAIARQIEAGVKVNWGLWTSSLAAFQISQPNGLLDPATNVFSQNGEQRNRGVEFNLAGEPVAGVRVLGGIALLDGRLTRTAGRRYDGNRAIGVPAQQLNLGIEWDTPFAKGLTLSARMIRTGRQFADAGNGQAIDGWTRFDLGARYVFEPAGGRPVTLRLAAENVFDRRYWASAASGQASGLSRGAPRTFLASTTFAF